MKFYIHFKLLIIVLLTILFTNVYSQEISKRGEIYDFEIGDVYHYKELESFGGGSGGYFRRTIDSIISKNYSENNDTIFYSIYRHWVEISDENQNYTYDTLIISPFYTNLDSLIFNGNIDTVYNNLTLYNGRIINYTEYAQPDYYSYIDEYVEGCGMTLDSWESIPYPSYGERYLVYYKKGEEDWGLPLIIVNTEDHYINDPNLLIYPNPVNGNQITLQYLNTEHHQNMELQCFNVFGNLVHTEKVYQYQGESKVDVGDWNSGMYLVNVYSQNKIVGQTKFVVQ